MIQPLAQKVFRVVKVEVEKVRRSMIVERTVKVLALDGTLSSFLNPMLSSATKKAPHVEGWFLG
jgi:hypothetical protein